MYIFISKYWNNSIIKSWEIVEFPPPKMFSSVLCIFKSIQSKTLTFEHLFLKLPWRSEITMTAKCSDFKEIPYTVTDYVGNE